MPAFFVGRLVSYTSYVGGAGALSQTSIGTTFRKSLTDWRGIAIEVVLLAAMVVLMRVGLGATTWGADHNDADSNCAGIVARAGSRDRAVDQDS